MTEKADERERGGGMEIYIEREVKRSDMNRETCINRIDKYTTTLCILV